MNVSLENLVDCIFLLVNENTPSTKNTVNLILNMYSEQNATMFLENEKPLAEFYISIIKTLIDQNLDKNNQTGLKSILIKFKSGELYKEYKSIFNDFEKEFTSEEFLPKETIGRLQKSLNIIGTQLSCSLGLKKCYAELSKLPNMNSLENKVSILRRLQSKFSELSLGIEKELSNDTAITQSDTYADFTNENCILKHLKFNENKRAVGKVIKTGLQGLNNFFGDDQGLQPGQSVVFVGGASRGKSLLLLKMLVWAAKYNELKPIDPSKKIMIYFISLENSIDHNIPILFNMVYTMENRVAPGNFTSEEKAKYLSEFFKSRDIHLGMEKFPAGVFTKDDFKDRLTTFKENGFEVRMVVLDYLLEMAKDIKNGAARDQQMQGLASSLCDFCKENSITLVTAHGLNTSSSNIPETVNRAKKYNVGHIAEGIALARVFDTLIFIDQEMNDNTKVVYLELFLGKNRIQQGLPESQKFIAYPFIDRVIGIADDVGEEPGFVRDIYNDPRYSAVNSQGDSSSAINDDIF